MNEADRKQKREKILFASIHIILVAMIIFSITVTYYVMIVQHNYDVITQEGGPDLEE